MEKIALICDSSCDIPKDLLEKYNINLLSFRIIYKDREFRDGVEISPKEVYDNITNELPTTSLPSIKDMDDTFNRISEEGYTHAIVISISSGLSGTFNALNLVAENYPNLKIHIYDSKFLTMATGTIGIRCAELIAKGCSFDEIIETLPKIREKLSVHYVIDTLEYLKKGGRIGKVAGTIGELLNIKPIILINDQGVYETAAKGRGKKQALSKLLDIVKSNTVKGPCNIGIMHGGAFEEAKKLLEQVKNLPNVLTTYFGEISPSLGVHTGPGLVGVVIEREF
ncbi:DegV family protein [Clostridium hydrogeniformans]|uniref:DegV family protein n=1 Tax=Clostridium hydrogeniformans TaxID=349933 RepID=UPI000484453F|nr:DegV family protein [Clostridium hydrogeniformans]